MTTKLTDIIETTTDTLEVVQSVIDTASLIANKIPDALPAEARIAGRIAALNSLPSTRHRRRVLAKLQAQLKVLEST